MNSMMPITQPLEILSKNDWRSSRFMSSLVEDRTRNDVSYVEFLVQVHKKIQQKFH
jgi:protein transport protein SEC24